MVNNEQVLQQTDLTRFLYRVIEVLDVAKVERLLRDAQAVSGEPVIFPNPLLAAHACRVAQVLSAPFPLIDAPGWAVDGLPPELPESSEDGPTRNVHVVDESLPSLLGDLPAATTIQPVARRAPTRRIGPRKQYSRLVRADPTRPYQTRFGPYSSAFAKLTWEQAAGMRALHAECLMPPQTLVTLYAFVGASVSLVRRVLKGQTWREVEGVAAPVPEYPLTPADVRDIRQAVADGSATLSELAVMYSQPESIIEAVATFLPVKQPVVPLWQRVESSRQGNEVER